MMTATISISSWISLLSSPYWPPNCATPTNLNGVNGTKVNAHFFIWIHFSSIVENLPKDLNCFGCTETISKCQTSAKKLFGYLAIELKFVMLEFWLELKIFFELIAV